MEVGDNSDKPYALIRATLGDWWKDDRRNWCAYCGIPMRLRAAPGSTVPPTKATRDHVIPRKHKGGLLTIPACRACNAAKGSLSLQEFLLCSHFLKRRMHRHRNQWPLPRLWLVAAAAALKVSMAISATAGPASASRPE